MPRRKLLPLSLLLLGLIFRAEAQMNDKHALAAKVLLIDHGWPQDDDALDQTFGLELAYHLRLGDYFGFALPVKIGVIDVADDIRNRNITSVGGQVHLFPLTSRKTISPYLLAGAGYVLENLEDGNVQTPFGLGLHWRMGQTTYLNLQGEYRLSNQELRDNIQIGLGLIYRFGASDRDGDGLTDAVDECPDAFGSRELGGCPDNDNDGLVDKDDACPLLAGPASTKGCPDTDGDGFNDTVDDCPQTPGDQQGCPDTDGDGILDKDDACPALAGTLETDGCPDRDGDGVGDPRDACPDEPGDARNDGCPEADRDRDGVPDAGDQCPDLAGLAEFRGCPDTDGDGVPDKDDRCPERAGPYTGCPDTDGDGIMDADDRCPEEAGLLTNKGCPEIEEEVREVLELAMQAVQFETGSANLKEESNEILDQIAQIMGQYPAYRLIIAGHTDNVGDAEANQVLSENRARTCFQYLVGKGIPPARLSYAGYGEDVPLGDNGTPQGRRRNRRVEFSLIIE